MNRQASSIVLALLGGAVLRASISGQFLRYVKPGLRPYLIAAGATLVVVAAMTLWYELRPRAAASDHAGHADDGHGHHGEPRVAWMLILPVLGLLLVAPPALGSYAASRSGTALAATSDFGALPAGDPVRLTVLDYASRAVFEEGKSIADRHVQLTGFVAKSPDGGWYLARMVLTCCAADARPIKIGLNGEVPDGLTADTWLRIVGTYDSKITVDSVNGERIPYIHVDKADRIRTPEEQYES